MWRLVSLETDAVSVPLLYKGCMASGMVEETSRRGCTRVRDREGSQMQESRGT